MCFDFEQTNRERFSSDELTIVKRVQYYRDLIFCEKNKHLISVASLSFARQRHSVDFARRMQIHSI